MGNNVIPVPRHDFSGTDAQAIQQNARHALVQTESLIEGLGESQACQKMTLEALSVVFRAILGGDATTVRESLEKLRQTVAEIVETADTNVGASMEQALEIEAELERIQAECGKTKITLGDCGENIVARINDRIKLLARQSDEGNEAQARLEDELSELQQRQKTLRTILKAGAAGDEEEERAAKDELVNLTGKIASRRETLDLIIKSADEQSVQMSQLKAFKDAFSLIKEGIPESILPK